MDRYGDINRYELGTINQSFRLAILTDFKQNLNRIGNNFLRPMHKLMSRVYLIRSVLNEKNIFFCYIRLFHPFNFH
jgi:hypothetical protein